MSLRTAERATGASLAAVVLALAFRLRRAIVQGGTARVIPPLMALAGVGMLFAGVFEVERAVVPDSFQEFVHSTVSVAAFVSLVASMLLLSAACRTRWWTFRWTSTALAVVADEAACSGSGLAMAASAGVVHRVLAGAVLLWVLLTALRIRANAFRPRSPPLSSAGTKPAD